MIRIFQFLYLLILSRQDSVSNKIPNTILLGFFITAFCLDISSGFSSIPVKFISALFFCILFCLTARITNGLGYGDAKLIAVLGYSCGFSGTLIICLAASFIGICFFLLCHVIRGKDLVRLPFAPLLTAGYAAAQALRGLSL